MTGEKEGFGAGRTPASKPHATYVQLASIPDAAFVIDGDGRIEDVNAVAATLLGYEHDELCGLAAELVIEKLNPDGDRGCDIEDRVRFVSAGAGARAYHRDGHAIPVDVLVCSHLHRSIVAVVRPLDDARNRLCEDDVAQIVHDLKSPLATIALETELLDERINELDHAALHRAVDRITNNVDFLDRMVQDLLDLCAFDSGHFALHRERIDLAHVVDAVVERLVATRDRARVTVDIPDRAVLLVDELRIERVIANLVQNALKHTPMCGRIAVVLDTCSDLARVSVIDEGPGIDPLELGAIFEKYRRASTARAQGSGLGLFVSKKIVEAHGGRIGVYSVRGAGSRFFFELPMA
jgi:two-component system, OmpR family, sensor histidine kinase ResE